MMRRGLDFLEERTGYRSWLNAAAQSPLPGGSRWARTFGALTLALLLLEALTGAALSAWYAPSATDAWASVHFIQFQVTLGWLVRGLHHLGGTALIVVAVLHLLQVVVWGSYRAPRELTWISGVLAVLALVVISHTGYLLPDDLRAYWATQVLLGIAGNQPGIGPIGQTIIQGGPAFGNATLTHLYALHVLLGPGAAVVMVAAHLALRKKHGAAAPGSMSQPQATSAAQSYWPHQLLKDLAVAAAVMAALLLYAVQTHGVELGAPADPAIEYVARPEWYFYPVFQLRHWFTGSLEFIATSVLPGMATVALAALPFAYAALSKRTPRAQSLLTVAVVLGLVVTVALGGMTASADARDEKATRINEKAERIAHEAHRLAMIGVPVSGPLELYQNDPLVWGARVWVRDCAACHTDCSVKPFKGSPCLEGYATRAWLLKLMKNPSAPHFFGNTKMDEMEPYTGDEGKAKAIAEYLWAEGARPDVDAALAAAGRVAFDKEGCESCHTVDGVGTGDAPDLKGWATEAWLRDFIRTPDATRFYAAINEMDSFPHEKLSTAELNAVIAWLRAQTDAEAKYP